MCGIVGFWSFKKSYSYDEAKSVVGRMNDTLAHRGPDSHGVWVEPDTGVALGHRRLAIRDISELGHQPMVCPDKASVLVYNGEIYNISELKELLSSKGVSFKGHSDTEVLLWGCKVFGVQKFITLCVGMFAFAFYSKIEKKLYLCRDRLGIKPLYYSLSSKRVLFSSELKALEVNPDFDNELNFDALSSLISYGYIAAPASIYSSVDKLMPGSLVCIDSHGEKVETQYWSPDEVAASGKTRFCEYNDSDLLEGAHDLLREAVGSRLVSDVNLGAFLSGGIDSSLVTALMQEQSSLPVRTFAIGFEECGFDEAHYAKKIANYLGTLHTEAYLSSNEAQKIIYDLPLIYDEPFADSSQIPTVFLSQVARKDVTVALSGDGGDEVFAGYDHYFYRARLNQSVLGKLSDAPLQFFERLPPELLQALAYMFPKKYNSNFCSRVRNRLAATSNRFLTAHDLRMQHCNPMDYLQVATAQKSFTERFSSIEGQYDNFLLAQLIDIARYLPDDILVKVDRASMSTGLEVRVPLLDHRLLEYALALPLSIKVKGHTGKLVLRKILGRYLPEDLFERPKKGFSVPIDSWLRTGLRDWAEDLLDSSQMSQEGFFDVSSVRKVWARQMAGEDLSWTSLWSILMFQAWYRNKQ